MTYKIRICECGKVATVIKNHCHICAKCDSIEQMMETERKKHHAKQLECESEGKRSRLRLQKNSDLMTQMGFVYRVNLP